MGLSLRQQILALAVALGIWIPDARAQQPADPAAAQSLFDEGKRLMQDKNFAAACPKLAESQRLDPAGGTILVLALCHEGEGKTATAWAEFNQALSDARRDRRADRETAAAEHIRALEPRLAKVRIVVAKPVAEGIEVKRNGVVVGSAQWDAALAVDPGPHAFEATAPKKRPWSTSVVVNDEGRVMEITIPPLVDAPPPTPAPAAATAPGPSEPASPPERGASQRTWGIVLGGAGVVATGIGVGFGLKASSKWKDAERACPGGACPSDAAAQAGKEAGTAADLSTALIVVGGLAVAGGAALLLTAPSTEEKKDVRVRVTPWAGHGGGGIGVGGAL